MSSRDRREPLDPLEIRIRETLQSRAGEAGPSPELRARLLQRAGRQQRRLAWRLPFSLPGRFENPNPPYVRPAETQVHYLEALFGLRLGWFSYGHLMR